MLAFASIWLAAILENIIRPKKQVLLGTAGNRTQISQMGSKNQRNQRQSASKDLSVPVQVGRAKKQKRGTD
jgi:hypothetical protein